MNRKGWIVIKQPHKTKPIFWEKLEKYFKMLSAEKFTQRAKH